MTLNVGAEEDFSWGGADFEFDISSSPLELKLDSSHQSLIFSDLVIPLA